MANIGRPRMLTPEKEAELLALYQDHSLTLEEIGARFGMQATSVRTCARRAGLPGRPPGTNGGRNTGERLKTRRYFLNHDAFDNAESNPAASYFVGLILTDGCLQRAKSAKWKNRGSYIVSLAQAETRCDVVEKFKTFLSADNPIGVYPGKETHHDNIHRLTITSKKIFDKLVSYSIEPTKTSKQKVDARFADNRDFWRGVFDGDGSICRERTRSLRLSLHSTSPELIRAMVAYWEGIVGIGGVSVYGDVSEWGTPGWTVTLLGRKAVKVAEALYEGAEVYSNEKFRPYAELREILKG